MKSLAKFLTGITVVVVLLVGYYILSSTLSTTVTVQVQPASQRAEDFESLKSDVAAGKYEGVYSLGDIGSYSFVTVNVEAENFCVFPAEWAQLFLKEEPGDLLTLTSDSGPKDIDRFKADEFSVTLLTESSEPFRGGWLDYYIFGRSHSIEVFPKTDG